MIIDLFSIVSSFVILIFSLVILCLVGAKLIIVFVEQGKLWGRKSVTQLMPAFVGLAVILPPILDLIFYASDAAPSILLNQPVFNGDFHTAGGYMFIFGFYAQNFNLLLLSALKFKLMLQRMFKKAHILIKCSFFACWLISLSMAAAVQRKICKFEFDLQKFAYLCLEPESTNNTSINNGDGKLGTLNGTLVSALLLVTLFCIWGHIQRRKMPIAGIGAQNDPVETNPNRVRLADVLKNWNKGLLLQFSINVCRLIAFSALLFSGNHSLEKFVGLGVTLAHILCCCSTSLIYLDTFGLIIKYMHQLELRNLYTNSMVHFRLMASRRNLSQSFRHSCASFNQFAKMQQESELARAAAVHHPLAPTIPSVSANVSPISSTGVCGGAKATNWLPMVTPGGSSRTSSATSNSDCCSQTTRLTAMSKNVGIATVGVTTPDIDEFQNDILTPVRPGIPVLQVKNKGKMWIIKNTKKVGRRNGHARKRKGKKSNNT
uniref:Uncharacterized protein n=1 Tax=Romanomermis culicivorax TaxID=13658 RepID=A0A915I7F9_ROMCU